jgi:hypothetical protein
MSLLLLKLLLLLMKLLLLLLELLLMELGQLGHFVAKLLGEVVVLGM